MSKIAHAVLGLLVLLGSPAVRAGGEDFPFFCRVGGELAGQAFRLVSDPHWSTGYGVELYERGRLYAYVGAWIGETADQRNWQIYARERLGPFRDRQFLAQISKEGDSYTGADVKTTLRNADAVFYLSPASCGPTLPQK